MKFDMSRAWDDARAMLTGNTSMVIVVAGVFFFLPYFVLMLLSPDLAQNPAFQPGADDPDAVLSAVSALYADIWWMIILLALLQGVGTLALYALLKHRNNPTVGEAISFGFRGLLPYLGVALLQALLLMGVIFLPVGLAVASGSGVAAALASVIGFVLAIYLWIKLSLSTAVIGLEKQFNPIKALGRSWALTKGNSLRIFLFYFLLIIAFLVVSIVVGIITGVIFGLMGSSIALMGNGLISSLVNAVFVCGFLAVLAAVHQQLSGDTPETLSETFD